ncbi:MAG: hypothetical protein DYG90_01995 [Chloroflexi bacterium CFX6]|nr:hypothetical protein [Chloroflexi bacterium CFX6]
MLHDHYCSQPGPVRPPRFAVGTLALSAVFGALVALAAPGMLGAARVQTTGVPIAAVHDAPAAPASAECPFPAPHLDGCQPVAFSGGVDCGIDCATAPGTSCTVELWARDLVGEAPPVIPIPLATIEGWWSVWSESRQRRYLIYDGAHVIGGGNRRQLTFCARGCDLRLEGYRWVEEGGGDAVRGKVVDAFCSSCVLPTATPDKGARRLPERCVWRRYLPLAFTDTAPPPPTAPAVPLAYLGGNTTSVVAVGARVYAGTGMRLEVIDLPPTGDPPGTVGAHVVLPGPIGRVQAFGDRVFATTEDGAVHVVQPDAPGGPRVTATIPPPAAVAGVFITAVGLAYLAMPGKGIGIFDVRDPAHPAPLGGLSLPGTARDVVVDGDIAYVALGPAGLAVVDVRRPAGPLLRARVALPGETSRIVLAGRYAYAVAGGDVRLVDIRQPPEARLVLTLRTPGAAQAVAVVGDRAFVADGAEGITAFDVSNPLAPVRTDVVDTPDWAMDVAAAGPHAFVAARIGGLRVFEARDPRAVAEVGVVQDVAYPHRVALTGRHAIVATDQQGLAVVDVAGPGPPAVVGRAPLTGVGYDVAVAGDLAYVQTMNWSNYLTVVDVADRERPRVLSVVGLDGFAGQTAVGPRHAYLAVGQASILVMDLAVRPAPRRMADVPMPENVHHVALAGDHLYASMGREGLAILRLDDPARPRLIGIYRGGGSVNVVVVQGAIAYVAAGLGGLDILAVGDPAAPRRIGRVGVGGPAERVSVAGRMAYLVVGGHGRVVAVDVSDPGAPFVRGSFVIPGQAKDVSATADTVVVGGDLVGLVQLRPWLPAARQGTGRKRAAAGSGGRRPAEDVPPVMQPGWHGVADGIAQARGGPRHPFPNTNPPPPSAPSPPTSTRTRSPASKPPSSSASASGFSIRRWMTRLSGRAPYVGS